MKLHFDGLPEDWDLDLNASEDSRGVTLRYVLEAIDWSLQRRLAPHDASDTTRRVDMLRDALCTDKWNVRVENRGREDFWVVIS